MVIFSSRLTVGRSATQHALSYVLIISTANAKYYYGYDARFTFSADFTVFLNQNYQVDTGFARPVDFFLHFLSVFASSQKNSNYPVYPGEQDVPYSRQTFGSVFTVLLISLQFCDVKLPNYPRIFLRSCALPSLACSPSDAKFLPQQLLLKLFLNRLWRPVLGTFHLQTLQNHNQCQIIFFDN